MRKTNTEQSILTTTAWTPVADNQILPGLLQLHNKYGRRLATTQKTVRGL